MKRVCLECGCLMPEGHDGDICEVCQEERGGTISDRVRASYDLPNVDLRKGDCLEVMSDIPDHSVDMILCDLPYGTTQNKWDIIIPFDPLWEQYRRVIKANGAIVLTATPPFSALCASSNIDWFRYSWYWKKPHTGQLNAHKMPLKNVEEILVFYGAQPTYNPQFTVGKPYRVNRKNFKGSECYGKQKDHETISDGKRFPMQILEFGFTDKRVHPTQKPVSLMEYLIKTYTNEGETVLDNCMGGDQPGSLVSILIGRLSV